MKEDNPIYLDEAGINFNYLKFIDETREKLRKSWDILQIISNSRLYPFKHFYDIENQPFYYDKSRKIFFVSIRLLRYFIEVSPEKAFIVVVE